MIRTNTNKITGRIEAIDVAKGIGILLVIIAHVLSLADEFQTAKVIIYSFHMPLFFFISGYCYKKEKYKSIKSFIKSRTKTTIIPYLIFSAGSFFVYAAFLLVSHGINHNSVKDLLNSFIQIFIAQYSFKFSINIPMWFVTCLLAVEIIYYFISKLNSNLKICLVITIMVVLGWFSESKFCPVDTSFLPWNLGSAFFSIGFYALGNLLKPYITKYFFQSEKDNYLDLIIKLSVSIILFVICSLSAIKNGMISIGHRELHNGFYLYITGISGTISLLLFSQLIKTSKILKFFGSNSFAFMACHYLIMNCIIQITTILNSRISFIPALTRDDFKSALILLIADIVFSVIFVLLYKKLTGLLKRKFSIFSFL